MPSSKYPLLWDHASMVVFLLMTRSHQSRHVCLGHHLTEGCYFPVTSCVTEFIHSLDHDPVAQTYLVHCDRNGIFVVPVVILSPEAWKNQALRRHLCSLVSWTPPDLFLLLGNPGHQITVWELSIVWLHVTEAVNNFQQLKLASWSVSSS